MIELYRGKDRQKKSQMCERQRYKKTDEIVATIKPLRRRD